MTVCEITNEKRKGNKYVRPSRAKRNQIKAGLKQTCQIQFGHMSGSSIWSEILKFYDTSLSTP